MGSANVLKESVHHMFPGVKVTDRRLILSSNSMSKVMMCAHYNKMSNYILINLVYGYVNFLFNNMPNLYKYML